MTANDCHRGTLVIYRPKGLELVVVELFTSPLRNRYKMIVQTIRCLWLDLDLVYQGMQMPLTQTQIQVAIIPADLKMKT